MTKLLADVYTLHDPRHGPLDDLTAALERKEIRFCERLGVKLLGATLPT
jgi:hypothetical protein